MIRALGTARSGRGGSIKPIIPFALLIAVTEAQVAGSTGIFNTVAADDAVSIQ